MQECKTIVNIKKRKLCIKKTTMFAYNATNSIMLFLLSFLIINKTNLTLANVNFLISPSKIKHFFGNFLISHFCSVGYLRHNQVCRIYNKILLLQTNFPLIWSKDSRFGTFYGTEMVTKFDAK